MPIGALAQVGRDGDEAFAVVGKSAALPPGLALLLIAAVSGGLWLGIIEIITGLF